jgi:DNA gyrase subunit B
VEGDSAGGTAKMGRDRRTQAILPLRGKILNIERARLDRMLSSEQIKNLVVAFGTAIGDTFDIEKLRYHKIIIATDADVDGAHIRTLLLTLLFRYFRPLIDGGFVYIAQPPLYKIKRGKEVSYAYTEDEKVALVGDDSTTEEVDGGEEEISEEEVEGEADDESDTNKAPSSKPQAPSTKVSIQRYKGLGEMNAEELKETTMDPANRILKQVTVDDAQEADQVFDILMGTDVPSRKSFIQSNAKAATLDI